MRLSRCCLCVDQQIGAVHNISNSLHLRERLDGFLWIIDMCSKMLCMFDATLFLPFTSDEINGLHRQLQPPEKSNPSL